MNLTHSLLHLSLLLSSALLAAGDSPPPQLPVISSIASDSPQQCSPGQDMSITFLPDVLRLELRGMALAPGGHGRTDENAVCQFTAEFGSWWYRYRFALANVTYRGHFEADDGVQLHELAASAVFRYENRKVNPERAPPDVWNVSMATMIDNTAQAAIGGSGVFNDDFSVSAPASADLEWSTCMDGGEGTGDAKTKILFILTATTSDKTGEGTGKLTGGMTFDFGVVWEACTPDRAVKNAWGQKRIDDWSVCTYNDTSLSSSAVPRALGAG